MVRVNAELVVCIPDIALSVSTAFWLWHQLSNHHHQWSVWLLLAHGHHHFVMRYEPSTVIACQVSYQIRSIAMLSKTSSQCS